MEIHEARADSLVESILTIGVYGLSGDEFVARLREAEVAAVADVRLRRGVRGAEYAWANLGRLEKRLAAEGIAYLSFRDLAPTAEIRALQTAIDEGSGTRKRRRSLLSPNFVQAYEGTILAGLDPRDTAARLEQSGSPVALFCVEGAPEACHRALIADWLRREGVVGNVTHLGS
ncbi:MAG: DUF488 family protein [Candidatus Limnocylindria bacterium]